MVLSLSDKKTMVEGLGEKFAASPAVFLVDYKGCTCSELSSLRQELSPHGARFAVVKNTLAKRAISGTPAAELDGLLSGPTGIVWSAEDVVSPAKVISKFAKDSEAFAIKGGVVDGALLSSEQLDALAKLPSREELLAKLLAVLNAASTRLLQTINAPSSRLVQLLGAWRDEKQKS